MMNLMKYAFWKTWGPKVILLGITAVSFSGRIVRSVSSVSWKSISSQTLPVPTESGSRMERIGCGLKPSEYFSPDPAR